MRPHFMLEKAKLKRTKIDGIIPVKKITITWNALTKFDIKSKRKTL